MSSLPEVELHPAWFFVCDDCGRRNYGSSPLVEAEYLIPTKLPTGMTARDVIESVTGEECRDDDRFVLWPDDVICSYCQSKFVVSMT